MAPDWTGAAEIAVMVDDAFQGRHIGPSLVDLVLTLGRQFRYPGLHAEVTLDNGKMRQILVRRGFSSIPEAGAYTMTLSLD
jgi:RimJ/RimL family protein N-acetyltransferase